MGNHSSITRRQAICVVAGVALVSLSSIRQSRLFAAELVPLGADRFDQRDDPAAKTRYIEGLDFSLDSIVLPPNMHVFVRGDRITLKGLLSLRGFNLTIFCREFIGLDGAMISTKGQDGKPSYTGLTGAPGSDGAKDTGAGGNGGRVYLLAEKMSGTLFVDASGGPGGDAMNGGPGLQGGPGQNADRRHPGTQGEQGHQGGLAGVPGKGGNGADVIVGAREFSFTSYVALSNAGRRGASAVHGKPGPGGPGGSPLSGYDSVDYHCQD